MKLLQSGLAGVNHSIFPTCPFACFDTCSNADQAQAQTFTGNFLAATGAQFVVRVWDHQWPISTGLVAGGGEGAVAKRSSKDAMQNEA